MNRGTGSAPTVLISAGDASGELHAAALARELVTQVPGMRLIGLGGPQMQKAGVALVADQEELAVGGLVEVLRDLGGIVGTWRRMVRCLRDERPDLAILVDSYDFNIPFAKQVRRLGIPVLYFISPQVWAWRKGRMKKVARRVDRMAVIFPFEETLWREAGVDAEFVGHPLVDRIPEALPGDRAGIRDALGLDADRPLVVLLPGSRRNELRSTLPVHLQAAAALHARNPRVAFSLALAPSLDAALAHGLVDAAGLPSDLAIQLVEGRTYDAIRAADAALAMPGTVTVETALLGTPQVVAGRMNGLTAAIARRVVDVPSFTMPNLILGETVIPEFIQEDARPEPVAEALLALLGGEARERQLAAIRRLRGVLGRGGAAARAATLARSMIEARHAAGPAGEEVPLGSPRS